MAKYLRVRSHWNGYLDLSSFDTGLLGLGLDADVGMGGSGGWGNSDSADMLSFNGASSLGTTGVTLSSATYPMECMNEAYR